MRELQPSEPKNPGEKQLTHESEAPSNMRSVASGDQTNRFEQEVTIHLEEEAKQSEYENKVNQNIAEIEAQVTTVVNKDITESYYYFAAHTLKCLVTCLALLVGSQLSLRLQWLLPVLAFQSLEMLFSGMILRRLQKGNLTVVLGGCCFFRAASIIGSCLVSEQALGLVAFGCFAVVLVVEVAANCYRVAKAIDQTFFIRMVQRVHRRSTRFCSRFGTCRSCWPFRSSACSRRPTGRPY